MVKHFKQFGIIAALVLFAGNAWAQGTSLGWGQKPTPVQSGTNPQGQLKVGVVGGVDGDTLAQPLRFNSDGSLKIGDISRDRDYPVITSLFSGANVVGAAPTGGAVIYQMQSAVYIGQFTRPTLMFRYSHAAQADTDSVTVGIRIWGKTSLASGTLHLWTPITGRDAVTDSCWANKTFADSAGATGYCLPTNLSFVLVRNRNPFSQAVAAGMFKIDMSIVGGTRSTSGTLRRVPASIIRTAGPFGTQLPLVDNAGAPCPYPYILVDVVNFSRTRAITATGDIWPRVQ